VADGNFGSKHPLFLSENKNLRASILATTHHKQTCAYKCRGVQQNGSWAHSTIREIRKRYRPQELPLSVKRNKEAFFKEIFLLKRESSKSTVVECNEVLEVNLFESKFARGDLTLTFSNSQDFYRFAFSKVFFPEAYAYFFFVAF